MATIVTDPIAVAAWCTTRCPECDRDLVAEAVEPEWPPLLWAFADHIMIRALVVVGCQGFWVISPSAVGLLNGGWSDWCLPPE